MKLLLDTHVFIWWEAEPDRLSPVVLKAITDKANSVLLSLASIWEMQIKIGLGKMTLSGSLPAVIARQQYTNGIAILSISADHIYALDDLADHHRDPFDRLIVAQARFEQITVVTADPEVHKYSVTTLW